MVGWPLVLRSSVLGAVLSGCALLAGIDDGKDKPNASDAGSSATDALVQSADGSVGGDAPAPGECVPASASSDASHIHASRVQDSAPVVINGEGSEWKCVDTLAFTTGELVVGLGPGRGVSNVKMQWDETHLYLLADVTTASPGGTAIATDNFTNDSFAFYVVSPTPALAYTANDHHYVIDHRNQVADYEISTRPAALGITAQAGTVHDDGTTLNFTVEARIDVANVGRTAFAKGDVVRVNFQVNDQPDVGNNYRLWFREAARCVASGTCPKAEPFCDPRCTGEVELR
jgi:hypothetical protein